MFISRSVIFAFLIAVSAGGGWLLNSALHGETASSPATEVVATSETGQPAIAPPAANVYLPEQAPPTIHLTIVTPSGERTDGTSATLSTVAPTGALAPQTSIATAVDVGRASGPVSIPGRPTAQPSSDTSSSGGSPQIGSSVRRVAATGSPHLTSSDEGVVLHLTPEVAVTGIGENIVIAYDGSIVYVGDDGELTANTGDAALGGAIALDAQSSTLSSSYDPNVLVAGPGQIAGAAPNSGTAGGPSIAGPGVVAGGSYSQVPSDVSPLASAFALYTQNRTADIAGFEDHSVLTRGVGNIVTYDDSNVFMDRDGKINANTGDTDSAGLNAVAVVRSIVTAGPHCDDGCDDESIIQAEAGVFDEGDVAIDGHGNVVWAPDATDESPVDDDSEDDSLPADNGDDDDSEDDESPDGDVSDPAEPAETREEADSTRLAAGTGVDPVYAPADGSLTVGGDGIDDLSLRVDGFGNVASYDDSNVVVGGAGDVNAQIGDSDTGGTVVMDIVDSAVSGGDSR